MNYEKLKEQLLSKMDDIIKTIMNDKTLEIRKGKDNDIQLFEVNKKKIKE